MHPTRGYAGLNSAILCVVYCLYRRADDHGVR
jgi:hypothetical protein